MAFTRPRAAQINFDATNISDSIIRINSAETGDNTNDLGIVFERGNHTNAALVFDESADAFRFISTTHTGAGSTTDINISGHHNLHVGTLAASSLVLDGTTITATPANFNVLDGLTVTTTELNYVDGVTSNIQTQIDNISSSFTLAADSGTPDTFTTGQTLTIAGGTGIDTTVSDNNISIAIDSTVATQSYVTTQISNLVDSAPTTLDTLNELAAALGDDANFSTTVTNSIATKLSLAGGTMTGAIAMGTNKITGMGDPTANQDAATKAYVDTQTSSIVTTTDIAGDSGTDTVTLGSDTLTFSGTANEITTAVTNNTVTISLPDDVTIGSDLTVTGNLTVNGTTTTISTTNSVVSDSLIELNTGATSNANDLGIVMERGSTGDNAIFAWDESADAFVMGTTTATGASTGNLTIANGELRLDTLRIDQSGTGLRMTNVGAFDNDGSNNFRIFATNDLQLKANGDSGGGLTIDAANQDVTIENDLRVSAGQFYYGGTAVTSTATELNLLDGVTGTLVTEAGTQTLTNKTLTSPTITGTGAIAGTFTGNITGDVTGNVTGNADTATALATARNIAGQSFDGTGDITIASTDLSDTASIVLTTASQTLTNKTLTAPVISTISNTGTLTLPTSTGTVALTSDITLSTLSVTATAAELNILDGVTATTAELNYTDGVTSAIQTQLDTKASLTGSETLTNKTLTSPQVNTNIDLLAQADLRFYDSDDSNYVGFQAPATATGNILWTLPGSDGTEGQVLSTNGGGTLAWEDPGSGGGSGSSYPNSTFSTVPGTNGDFDLSYNVAQTTQETPFESGGTDAFGVNLGSVFSLMDPIGSIESIDYGDSEAYVGA